MLIISSAFAILGDIHDEHPIMVAINGSTVHGTLFNLISNEFHPIGSMSHAFGWPYVGFGWNAITFKDNYSPNLDFHDCLDKKERKFPSSPKEMKYHAPVYEKNTKFKKACRCLV